ncbi:cation-translocating P-type ATPase [Gelria sp. Kuro-4]|uniref:cation-translocating P-type ATPase n=1 Tax=Gelria sp. Kuro-4 TaxID=2796927 RepID=UPI001BEE0F54|nr:cation-translocating P-type ATPase [Gelria sp. Kuro-4]BCV23801.1 ATPase [Gelria sp. Kuro-4]
MQAWHSLSVAAAGRELGTDTECGLTPQEAAARLERYGPNELGGKEGEPLWRKLLAQFQDYLVIILLAAGAVSFAVGERTDAALILLIVVLNAVLGVIQEGRAERALQALKQLAAPQARVLRGGRVFEVPAATIVPGDVVLLEAGSVVPCDLRLTRTASLKIEEAALTGESVPVEKDAGAVLAAGAPLAERCNLAYMGTTVVYGRGEGVACATGMATEMGRIAGLLAAAPEELTPLQQKLNALGKSLGTITLVICGVVFLTGFLRGAHTGARLLEMFLVAVSLAVAAIPEGLPAVVTIVLALGMQRMVERNAIVKRLHAVETLGSTTVICTDKTGTLTQNKMAAVELWCGAAAYSVSGAAYGREGAICRAGEKVEPAGDPDLARALLIAALCNDARVEQEADGGVHLAGDPTEGALLGLAAKGGLFPADLAGTYPRVAEVPFDSRRKLMSTIHPAPAGGYLVLTKGAPDVVLGRATRLLVNGREEELTPARRREILAANAALAGQALRVLALAYRHLPQLPAEADLSAVEEELTFVALAGLKDPLRAEAQAAVQRCRSAGIRTVMITGDHPDTAAAIGRELGLVEAGGVLSGVELDKLSPTALGERVRTVNVYARVAPEHKSAIVKALKEQGEVVAVTGDGVNDAPALKTADIGVAMGITGTDVAKGAADMILTDDNFASIVAAVEEGRVIYSNIRKFVYFLLSCNVGEVLIVFLAELFGLPLPLLPVQLLWLNLLTDAFPALALGVEKAEPGIMDRPPRSPREPILDRPMTLGIIVQSAALTAAALGVFTVALGRYDVTGARALAFTTLVLAELLRAYTSRSERIPVLRLGLFSNPSLFLGTGFSLLLFLSTIYVPALQPVFRTIPLSWNEWRLILPAAFLPAAAAEAWKQLRPLLTGNGDKRKAVAPAGDHRAS